jgi:hypothetical protein
MIALDWNRSGPVDPSLALRDAASRLLRVRKGFALENLTRS